MGTEEVEVNFTDEGNQPDALGQEYCGRCEPVHRSRKHRGTAPAYTKPVMEAVPLKSFVHSSARGVPAQSRVGGKPRFIVPTRRLVVEPRISGRADSILPIWRAKRSLGLFQMLGHAALRQDGAWQ